MQRFGRLQQDVENCLRKLVAFGIARRAPGTPAQYEAARPGDSAAARLLDGFLAEQGVVNLEYELKPNQPEPRPVARAPSQL